VRPGEEVLRGEGQPLIRRLPPRRTPALIGASGTLVVGLRHVLNPHDAVG
jgi:hypothetical protein